MTKDASKVKGIYLYFDIYQSTKLMSNEQKAMFLDAILTKFNGNDFEITDPVVQMAFSFVERSFNYEQEKVLQRSEKARESINKRWEYERINRTQNDTNEYERIKRIQSNTNEYEAIRTDTNDTINKKQEIKNINNNIKNTSYSLSASDADDTQNSLLEGEKTSHEGKGIADCPHQQIIDLYHECLPELRRVKRWTKKRASLLKARWRENWDRYNFNDSSKVPSIEGGLDYWKRFFTWIHGMDFLMGKINDFQADLEWIIKPSNFTHITEKKYLNRV